MKKVKYLISAFALSLACSAIGINATISGWKTIKVNSLQAITAESGYKSTNENLLSASLSAIGEPDTILFFGHTRSGALCTDFSITESSTPSYTTYGSGTYYKNLAYSSGTYVRAAVQAKNFSLGTFPINTNIDFH